MKDFDLHHKTPEPKFLHQLPPVDLATLDLNQELADNLTAARQLRLDITHDDTPVNQKAQVMNTITTILTNLVKLQTDLYNSQRQKELEGVLIQTMQQMPEEVQEIFFNLYTKNTDGLK
jgi:hydroxypyruvate isomerase